MSRINTNVTSLIAQRVLKKNNDQLNTSLERLSTGLKINSGKDNPAGLIASEILKGAQLPNGATQSVTVTVTNSATQGELTFTGAGLAAAGTTLEIAGADGTQQLSFAASATSADIATAINNLTSVTGVTASATAG